MININDFPDEVLEFIFSHLPPYSDLENCNLVCKRWHQIVHGTKFFRKLLCSFHNFSLTDPIGVKRLTTINFHKNLGEYKLYWKPLKQVNEITPLNCPDGQPPRRFSHASVVYNDSMYIFGGGSSTSTTFNDLWRFDLSKRQWKRLQSVGTYPSPKACSTMVYHKEILILFGGWRYLIASLSLLNCIFPISLFIFAIRHPPSYPPYQSWRLFDELHVYDLKENRWTALSPLESPPPMVSLSTN